MVRANVVVDFAAVYQFEAVGSFSLYFDKFLGLVVLISVYYLELCTLSSKFM